MYKMTTDKDDERQETVLNKRLGDNVQERKRLEKISLMRKKTGTQLGQTLVGFYGDTVENQLKRSIEAESNAEKELKLLTEKRKRLKEEKSHIEKDIELTKGEIEKEVNK